MTALDPSFKSGVSASDDLRDVAMLAHDIRGALQGVVGGILQIEAEALDPAVREQVERVAEASRALACLVGTAIGDPPSPVALKAHSRVEVRRFLRHLGRRWSGEARERRIGFVIDAARDLPHGLRVDLVLIDRAIGNLIGNAIRHSDGAVRLGAARSTGGGIEFSVTDEGPGLSDAVLARVRQRGVSPTGSGHGLGLHIVRSLTEQLGGALTLDNRAGGGLEAVVRFPAELCFAAGPVPATDPSTDPPAEGASLRPDLGGLRILLAEDNPTNQMVATQMLKALNAEVTISSDGVEALERFETEEFDLIVVDIEMPRMSGLDVIRAIRARRDGRGNLPIIALTAYALREHRERIAEAGANGLISKPITSIDALGRTLRSYLAPLPPRPVEQPAAPRDTGKAIDLAIYDALCEAIGPEMMSELLEKVVADLLSARADLAAASEPLDRGPIRSASHILISVAGAVGATRLQASARTLNAAANSGDGPGLVDGVRACMAEIDAAVHFARARRAVS